MGNSDVSPQSHRYRLIVWYLGTNFHGSQLQPHLRTVEGEIISALRQAGYIPRPIAANKRENERNSRSDSSSSAEMGFFRAGMRTDRGVHAREHAFCFTTSKPLYPSLIAAKLPSDIGLVRYGEVSLTFQPRWECRWKEYRYFYPLSKEILTILDISSIQEGLNILQGTHDFRMFSKTDRTRRDKLSDLTIDSASLLHDEQGLIFIFRSQAFSWEQIRRTVYFLIHMGLHQFSLVDLRERIQSDAIANKLLRKTPAFPAEGLILWHVDYPESVVFTSFVIRIHPQEKYLLHSQVVHLQNAHSAHQIHQSLFSDLDPNIGKKTNPKNHSKDQ
ncbi:MAG: hypothetical protein E4G98_01605 [Promethearchaeota archaeon]|nr:MAG: hypothetical protein E4G98_01605 [Candidatus Lokiarchaeota archaeon]